jgi:hypothetical protein
LPSFITEAAERIGITPAELGEWIKGECKSKRVHALIAADEDRRRSDKAGAVEVVQ